MGVVFRVSLCTCCRQYPVRATGNRKFLGEALALLFPIDWPEPFGLVMIPASSKAPR